MNEEKKFAEGLYYNEPRDGSPEWILGSISIEPKKFTDWMRANYDKNEKYIKIDIKMGKSGKPYTELNTWKPTQGSSKGDGRDFEAPRHHSEQSTGYQKPSQDDFQEQIPF